MSLSMPYAADLYVLRDGWREKDLWAATSRRNDYSGLFRPLRTDELAAWMAWLAGLSQSTTPYLSHSFRLRPERCGSVFVPDKLFFSVEACSRFRWEVADQDVGRIGGTDINEKPEKGGSKYKGLVVENADSAEPAEWKIRAANIPQI